MTIRNGTELEQAWHSIVLALIGDQFENSDDIVSVVTHSKEREKKKRIVCVCVWMFGCGATATAQSSVSHRHQCHHILLLFS
jgi:hypothetical protein